MSNITVVFCEGNHDIAFLKRVLYEQKYLQYKNCIQQFIKPFSEMYLSSLKNSEISDMKFDYTPQNYKVPYLIMERDNNVVMFHNLDGESKFMERSESIKSDYMMLNDAELVATRNGTSFNYKFLYFLDADEYGVLKRNNKLNNFLKRIELKHGELIDYDGVVYGLYIFHDAFNTQKLGTLEDILLKWLGGTKSELLENSRRFFDENKQKQFNEAKTKKAVISILGQVFVPASSMSSIIRDKQLFDKKYISTNN